MGSSKALFQQSKKTIIFAFLLLAVLSSQILFAQTIIYSQNNCLQEQLAAKEVRRYIYLRTGEKLELKKVNSVPAKGNLILVADYDDKMIKSLKASLGCKPNPSGFIIKTVKENSRKILVITGYDSTSTLYGAYRFAEHLGVGFDLTRDVIPDKEIKLDISGFDEVGEPVLQTRGILPFHDFPPGPDLWDTDEYMTIISQLPKLGMNFIGLHTYPRWSTTGDKDDNIPQGPEPTVWIGTKQDINPDGTVKWSYPAYYGHTHRPDRIWGFAARDTQHFHAGASQLFESNGFGSEVIGENVPSDVQNSNQVFNRTGEMFNKSFSHARNLGVKTALGTELPMGLEPKGPDAGYDWIRGIPPKLQKRLEARGKELTNPSTIKEVYKGIFERIKRVHPLDYYWLWTWEGWVRWSGSDKQVKAFEEEIQIARQALEEVDAPFDLAMAGWMLGSNDNPDEFEDILPPEVPFYGLWDRAMGFEELSEERVKWPATWLEEDWGLVQPQLEADRVYEDTKAALGKRCDGLIAKHWRTRVLSSNIGAMKDLIWAYHKTSESLENKIPKDKNKWIDEFYLDWAKGHFGKEAAPEIAQIFARLEKKGTGDTGSMKTVLNWDSDEETDNGAPGAVMANPKSWESEKSAFKFVTEFEKLREKIAGSANLERFDYWLNVFECYRLMGEYGTVRYKFEEALEEENWSQALKYRKSMARLFEKIMAHQIQKVSNASDLGEIITLEILNWYQLVMLKWDKKLQDGLGKAIPADANPSMEYDGPPLIMVDALRTSLYENEPLNLKARVIGKPESVTLFYRPLGEGKYESKQFNNIGRGVFSITVPPQESDFEYYIEAKLSKGNIVYPVTAPDLNQTIIIIK